MMEAHWKEYSSKVMVVVLGGVKFLKLWIMLTVTWKKFCTTRRKYTKQTKNSNSMLTVLFNLSSLIPPILLIDSLNDSSSLRLWTTSNLQVKKLTTPITSITRTELIIPSLMKRTGYTMIAEPTMVLARDVTVLKEVSAWSDFELLSVLILNYFWSGSRNLSSSIYAMLL